MKYYTSFCFGPLICNLFKKLVLSLQFINATGYRRSEYMFTGSRFLWYYHILSFLIVLLIFIRIFSSQYKDVGWDHNSCCKIDMIEMYCPWSYVLLQQIVCTCPDLHYFQYGGKQLVKKTNRIPYLQLLHQSSPNALGRNVQLSVGPES